MYYRDNELPVFKSDYSKYIVDYIKHMRANGFKYNSTTCYVFLRFDKFLIENNYDLTVPVGKIIDEWLKLFDLISLVSKKSYYNIIYSFFVYLNKVDNIQIPEKIFFKKHERFIPYIFDDDEITKIFDKAYNQIPNSDDKITYQSFYCLLCLYYGCGLRKNEALNLKVKDYNLETGVITIWKGKNNVSRIIPLSESINKNIMILMELNSYSDNDDFIFKEHNQKKFRTHILYKMFKSLLKKAGIALRFDGKSQRIHDLRHTFAINALKQMEIKGYDTYASLPLLSVYMGHKSVLETEYYLKFTKSEYTDVINKINEFSFNIYNNEVEYEEWFHSLFDKVFCRTSPIN